MEQKRRRRVLPHFQPCWQAMSPSRSRLATWCPQEVGKNIAEVGGITGEHLVYQPCLSVKTLLMQKLGLQAELSGSLAPQFVAAWCSSAADKMRVAGQAAASGRGKHRSSALKQPSELH